MDNPMNSEINLNDTVEVNDKTKFAKVTTNFDFINGYNLRRVGSGKMCI